jgi:hypothetical protein
VRLSYRALVAGGWRDVVETVRVVRAPCRYGGARPFFACPRCDGRVAKLHEVGHAFLCRRCGGLAYDVQRERPYDRARRRADKARRRLDGDLGGRWDIPERPTGMWRRTYNRLQAALAQAETAAEEAFDTETCRLLSRLGA